MNIFEEASRQKLRFPTAKGNLTVEQLWDLPLDKTEVNLYQLASELVVEVQSKPEKELSFLKKATTKNKLAELKFNIVKHIVTTRVAEIEEKEQEEVIKSEIAELDKLIAAKTQEAKASLSVNELIKMKAKLSMK